MQHEMLDELEYRNQIKAMGDRELSEHTALEVYRQNQRCIPCMEKVEEHDHVITRLLGGIAVLAVVFTAALAALFRKVL